MSRGEDREDGVMEQLEALGYIDPGAGSSAFQLMLGGFFKASRAVKSVLRRALRFGRRDKSEKRD